MPTSSPACWPIRAPFDAYKELPVRVSSTCLVAYDANHYSVESVAAGQTPMLRVDADRIVVVEDGRVLGEHVREFGRHQVRYNPWHYVSVLLRKPGALRNESLGQPVANPGPTCPTASGLMQSSY